MHVIGIEKKRLHSFLEVELKDTLRRSVSDFFSQTLGGTEMSSYAGRALISTSKKIIYKGRSIVDIADTSIPP